MSVAQERARERFMQTQPTPPKSVSRGGEYRIAPYVKPVAETGAQALTQVMQATPEQKQALDIAAKQASFGKPAPFSDVQLPRASNILLSHAEQVSKDPYLKALSGPQPTVFGLGPQSRWETYAGFTRAGEEAVSPRFEIAKRGGGSLAFNVGLGLGALAVYAGTSKIFGPIKKESISPGVVDVPEPWAKPSGTDILTDMPDSMDIPRKDWVPLVEAPRSADIPKMDWKPLSDIPQSVEAAKQDWDSLISMKDYLAEPKLPIKTEPLPEGFTLAGLKAEAAATQFGTVPKTALLDPLPALETIQKPGIIPGFPYLPEAPSLTMTRGVERLFPFGLSALSAKSMLETPTASSLMGGTIPQSALKPKVTQAQVQQAITKQEQKQIQQSMQIDRQLQINLGSFEDSMRMPTMRKRKRKVGHVGRQKRIYPVGTAKDLLKALKP